MFAATDQGGQRVALKWLRAVPNSSWAQTLEPWVGVAHPNLCTLLECGEIAGRPYVVSEWVDGPSLRSAGPLPLDATLDLFRGVALALGALHDRGLIHGDVSLGNVLLSRAGPRLSDAGLARALRASADERVFSFRTSYLSPEERRGNQPDGRADQYAWAVSCWEALLGSRPRRAEVSEPKGELPEHVLVVLRRALSDDPTARFESMSALVKAL